MPTPGSVLGGPGRPELRCVGAPGGLMVHLLHPTEQTVLCNGIRGGRVTIGDHDFALLACSRCAIEAIKRGYDTLLDLDGERVALTECLQNRP